MFIDFKGLHYDILAFGDTTVRRSRFGKKDSRTVVVVILGGGAGSHLFPLTKRRAKPDVSLYLLFIFLGNTNRPSF